MVVDARAAALGGAMTAQTGSPIDLFHNPSGIARIEGGGGAALARMQWTGADINYNAAALAFRPANGRYGVLGLSVLAVDLGEFIGTVRSEGNPDGFRETGTFSPTSFAVGLGYAHALTDRFAVGGQAKYVRESLGPSVMGAGEGGDATQDNTQAVAAFDFGVAYSTGFRSLDFAATVRNFAREVTYERENLELPLTFQLGVSMDLTDFTQFDQNLHAFVLSVDATRPRDYAEQLRVGGEYVFMGLLALRAGYAFPTDEEGIHLGAGLQFDLGGIALQADYAYSDFGLLGDVNRFGLRFGF